LARAQIEDRISPTGSDACRKPRESDEGTTRWTSRRIGIHKERARVRARKREIDKQIEKEREKEIEVKIVAIELFRERDTGQATSFLLPTGSHMPIYARKTVNNCTSRVRSRRHYLRNKRKRYQNCS